MLDGLQDAESFDPCSSACTAHPQTAEISGSAPRSDPVDSGAPFTLLGFFTFFGENKPHNSLGYVCATTCRIPASRRRPGVLPGT